MTNPDTRDPTLEDLVEEVAGTIIGPNINIKPQGLRVRAEALENDSYLREKVLAGARRAIMDVDRKSDWFPRLMEGIAQGTDAERLRLAAFYRALAEKLTKISSQAGSVDQSISAAASA